MRKLEEFNGLTQTSLDWSEEMEEEDRRSLAAEKPKQLYYPGKQEQQPTPPAAAPVFACSDIRYRNKPMQGYTVMPSSNGTSDSVQPTGRPVFGQGRRQDSTAVPRLSVPGLIQLPSGPPPSNQPRHSPRRTDGPQHFRDYDRGHSSGRPSDFRNNNNDPTRNFRKTPGVQQRTLFDPANPHKPIVVAASREDPHHHHPRPDSPLQGCPEAYLSLPADHGTGPAKPLWYDPKSDR